MKQKIAICDDNKSHTNIIEDYLDKCSKGSAECDVYYSGEGLVWAYQSSQERYDVIFLDMEMEQLNGIETANKIRAVDEHVIIVFITSHTEYMRESFQCAPFRFLVKPVEYTEFEEVYRDICKKLSKQRRVFAFTENKSMVRLYCDDIIYCESQDHSILIHTKDRTYKFGKPLNELYMQLDNELFCRTHKSFIINLMYIKLISEKDAELYHCDRLVPISRSYKRALIEEYTNFLERDFSL